MMLCIAHCKRAGFTLIEIMIVIAIIAILAGIVVPNFMQARAEANTYACRENILTIVNAINQYLTRHSQTELCWQCSKYKSGSTVAWCEDAELFPFLIENGYLEKVPVCPLGLVDPNTGYSYSCVIYPSSGYYSSEDWAWCGSYVACYLTGIIGGPEHTEHNEYCLGDAYNEYYSGVGWFNY